MKLLLTGCFKYSEDQLNEIKELGYEITFVQNEIKKLEINFNEFDSVVCNGLFLNNDIDLFKNIKTIQLTSAGLERFPVEKVDLDKVNVCNAKGVYSIPIAEWVILKILEIYKSSHIFIEQQKNKAWEKKRDLIELNSQNVCIIGAGSIGTEIAKRLQSFGVYIIGFDTSNRKKEFFDEMYLINDIYNHINKFDILILAVPLSKFTYEMINKNFLDKMKNTSIIVNVSRGKIIKQNDLISSLREKKIAGAILDVFDKEPLEKENELWNMKNVIITPHNSFVSNKNNERLYNIILNNLKATITEGEFINRVYK